MTYGLIMISTHYIADNKISCQYNGKISMKQKLSLECQAVLGKIMTHGGTDGHNYANCLLIPRFKVGLNLGKAFISSME